MGWTQIGMIIGYILVTLINVIYSVITSLRTGKKIGSIKDLEAFTIDYPMLQELIAEAEKLDGCTGTQKFNYVFIEYITRKTQSGAQIDKNAVKTAINALVSLTNTVNVKVVDNTQKCLKIENTGENEGNNKLSDKEKSALQEKVTRYMDQSFNNDPPFPQD